MEHNQQQPNAGSGLGIAALILGIIALPLSVMRCTFMGGLVLGILGVALSAVGYTQAKKVSAPTSLLMAALIISIISTSLSAIQLSKSFIGIRDFPWEKLENKIEKLERIEENSEEFEEVFEKGFEKELGGELEDVLLELEDELEGLEDDMEQLGEDIDNAVDSVHINAAYKLGKATGKALRKFVDELNDSTDAK